MKDRDKGGNSKLPTLKVTKFKLLIIPQPLLVSPYLTNTSSLFVMLKELLMMS